MRLAFRVSYIGTRFYGSQVQARERTVEGEIVSACQRLQLFSDFRQAGFLSAGRTDRGVHARGQVIAFTTEYPDRAIVAINNQLPPDIWCTGYAEVPPQFHPRFDARSRTYRYYFPVRPADPDAMGRAARMFCGNHNFSNFARVGDKNPTRTVISAAINEENGFFYLEVTADSFLWHQVRCMAMALASVGAGESDTGCVARLLEKEAERAIPPAPAEGLILWDTDCGVTFSPIAPDERSMSYLSHLRSHHALMEQVCTAVSPVQRQ